MAVAAPAVISFQLTGRIVSQPAPLGVGRAIQMFLLDSRLRPLICEIASSTVSLPVTGSRATRSPWPAPW